MIKQVTLYYAACDVCSKTYNDGNGAFGAVGAETALEYARDRCEGYWWVAKAPGTAVLCDSEDPEHLARAREIADLIANPEERKRLTGLYRELEREEWRRTTGAGGEQ